MAQQFDADRAADLLLPLGGPYDPDAVVQAATTVAELVRHLNHATFHRTSLGYPSQLYRVVGGLRAGVYGLDQTLRQLATRLDRWSTDPRVGHDHGRDPSAACVGAAEHLRRAAAALAAVTRPLDTAHELASHLNLDETDQAVRQAFPPPATSRSTTPPPSPQQHRTTSSRGRAR